MKNLKILSLSLFVVTSVISLGCSTSYVPMKMEGTSMLPNIKNDERMLVETNVSDFKRGDIITFLYPKDTNKFYIKRVVGLPNETITITEGKVFINEKELDESYLDQTYNQAKSNFPPKLVPEGSYYVLGDNRDNSSDSRYWGMVNADLIKGKYYTTYWSSK